jgi:hypothetical protein
MRGGRRLLEIRSELTRAGWDAWAVGRYPFGALKINKLAVFPAKAKRPKA